MADFEVLDGGKNHSSLQRQKKVLSVLRVLMIVLVILLVLFVFARLLSQDGDSQTLTAAGGNYIYEISSDAVLDMQSCNGGLAILTTNAVIYVNRSGSSSYYHAHSYSMPAMCVSGDKVLLYDRGGTNYRIENEGGTLYESTAQQPIITASFGARGNYALALKSDTAQSSLLVYDRQYELTFQWQCASEYIISIALSPNGKSAAAAVMSASNAALYARVHLFDLSADSALASYDFDDALFSVQYVSNSRIAVLGESVLSYVTEAERNDVLTYSSVANRRFAFEADSGQIALLLAQYGNDASGELTSLNASGEAEMTLSLSEPVNWLSTSNRHVAVALDGSVEIYNMDGHMVGSVVSEEAAERILIDGTSIYILSANGISVYGVTAHITIETTVPENTTAAPQSSAESTVSTTAPPPIAAFTEKGTTITPAEG